MASELAVGPMDIDNSSELTKRLGVHNKAHKLLERHAKNFPPELAAWQIAPVDRERTLALDLDEVKTAALRVPGRRRFLADDDEVESASVHENSNGERAVVLLFRKDRSGRSAKGVIEYDDLTDSVEAYETEQAKQRGEAPTSVVAGDEEAAQALRDAAEQIKALQAQLEEAKDEAEGASDPEPFEGYADENAPDVIARLKEGGREEFGTAGLERIREYEVAHDNRKTVLEAVADALAATSTPEE